jgi:hypothetical protein
MATTIKRRYTQSKPEYRQYSDFFDRFLLQSNILNNTGGETIMVDRIVSNNLTAIKSTLYELEGDEANVYEKKKNITIRATIPVTERALEMVHERFELFCQMRQNLGHPKPTQWPKELLTERLRLEARLDVHKREAEHLRDLLDKAQEVKKQIDSEKVLQFGPRGNGELRNGELVKIDYQECGFKFGTLMITDDNSPYKGMSVENYRTHIVKPFRDAQNKLLKKLHDQKKKEMDENRFTRVIIPSYGTKKVSRNSLPPWPAGVDNLLVSNLNDAEEVDAQQSIKRVRRKN